MSQSKTRSFVEAAVNTASGFIISMVLTHFIFPSLTVGENIGITAIFTVVSIVRSYVVRRMFNRYFA